MLKRVRWMLPLAVLTASAVIAVTASGSSSAGPLQEGMVIHSTVAIGRGLDEAGNPVEAGLESWVRIGPDLEESALRATVLDDTGAVEQDAVRRTEDGAAFTHFPQEDRTVSTPRPERLSILMWTGPSIERELIDQGYEPAGETQVAGLPAMIFEKRIPTRVSSPDGAGDIAVGTLRRVYVGSDPYGVDLGEEFAHLLADGSELLLYYRHFTGWELVDEAPSGTFTWDAPGQTGG